MLEACHCGYHQIDEKTTFWEVLEEWKEPGFAEEQPKFPSVEQNSKR
jgi:hypothetical protein